MKVLITRAKEQAEEFAQLLQLHNIEPIIFPTIAIYGPSSNPIITNAIKNLYKATDVVFTSANAANQFCWRAFFICSQEMLQQKTFHTIGKKTKKILESFGFHVEQLPDEYNVQHLTQKILELPNIKKRKFVFFHGNLSDKTLVDALQQNGIQAEGVIAYRTVKPRVTESRRNEIERQLFQHNIDVVTFFSPSSAINFLKFFPGINSPQNFHTAAIGKTTANACRELGFRVDIIPHESTAESLVKELVKFQQPTT
jgi:uroporphyrinogen-III synthase